MAISNSTISLDQEKYLAKKLLARAHNRLVMGALCDQDKMMEGAGLVKNMVRYKRMSLPATVLTEGTSPSASSFSLEAVTVTLDQWGDFVEITDVAELTAAHPLVQEATKLLADNAARVMDREITLVMLAGTNVQYGDGSITARTSFTSTTGLILNNATIQQARVTMVNNGAPPKGGPGGDFSNGSAGNALGASSYIAVCGPEVLADLQVPSANLGTFVSAAVYGNQKALFNSEVGTWQGVRFIETNFIPKFILLGTSTAAVTSGAANGGVTITSANTGSLVNATTYQWKVTRKDINRGFEEAITISHTTATGASDESFTFDFPATAGYLYNLYFGANAAADSAMYLVHENIAPSATKTVTSLPTSGTNPPPAVVAAAATGPDAVHPIFLVADSALEWCGFYKPKMLLSGTGAEKSDPLAQKRTIGYKFFGKAVIKDQTRLLRIEVQSGF